MCFIEKEFRENRKRHLRKETCLFSLVPYVKGSITKLYSASESSHPTTVYRQLSYYMKSV